MPDASPTPPAAPACNPLAPHALAPLHSSQFMKVRIPLPTRQISLRNLLPLPDAGAAPSRSICWRVPRPAWRNTQQCTLSTRSKHGCRHWRTQASRWQAEPDVWQFCCTQVCSGMLDQPCFNGLPASAAASRHIHHSCGGGSVATRGLAWSLLRCSCSTARHRVKQQLCETCVMRV